MQRRLGWTSSCCTHLYAMGYRLQTPEERECVEACAKLAERHKSEEYVQGVHHRAVLAGERLLASRQPPARFRVEQEGTDWQVRRVDSLVSVARFRGLDAEAYAREHAARLNAEGK